MEEKEIEKLIEKILLLLKGKTAKDAIQILCKLMERVKEKAIIQCSV